MAAQADEAADGWTLTQPLTRLVIVYGDTGSRAQRRRAQWRQQQHATQTSISVITKSNSLLLSCSQTRGRPSPAARGPTAAGRPEASNVDVGHCQVQPPPVILFSDAGGQAQRRGTQRRQRWPEAAGAGCAAAPAGCRGSPAASQGGLWALLARRLRGPLAGTHLHLFDNASATPAACCCLRLLPHLCASTMVSASQTCNSATLHM